MGQAQIPIIPHRGMYYSRAGYNMMRSLNYRIFLRKEPEGGYTVIVPSLPGCVTFGETVDEAIAMAREAIELYIEGMLARGEEVPTEEGLLECTLTVEVPG